MSSTSSTTKSRPTPPSLSSSQSSGRTTPPSTGAASTSSRPAPPSTGTSSNSTTSKPSDGFTPTGATRPTPPAPARPTPPSPVRPTPPVVDRPTPPAVDRPTPPPANRPTPPSVDPGNDRPVPPAVHVPRYFWQPTLPVILPTQPRELPHVQMPPAPAPARKVDMSEVSTDVVQLLADDERLRDKKKTLFITTHPKLDAKEAKDKLAKGQTVYLAPDGGMHQDSTYKAVNSVDQLKGELPGERQKKLNQLQNAENRAADARRNDWLEGDIRRRESALPAFNSIYDMNRLNLNNMMVSEGGRTFNRNLITAMNVYNQSDVRREIARKWQANPDMSTSDFNRMANSVISNHVSNLYWQADYMGDWGTYLGSNPVPGLRYPDTQEDVDFNAAAIRQVSAQLPMLLNSSVLY